MKKLIIGSLSLLFVLTAFVSCTDKDPSQVNLEGEGQYLIFGNFFGFTPTGTVGNFYMIKEGKLYRLKSERINQNEELDYNGYTELSTEKYDLVDDLPSLFPGQLYTVTDHIIGCPDCADGGGTYIETTINGDKKYWYLDNTLNEPGYLVDLIKEVNERVRLLN